MNLYLLWPAWFCAGYFLGYCLDPKQPLMLVIRAERTLRQAMKTVDMVNELMTQHESEK